MPSGKKPRSSALGIPVEINCPLEVTQSLKELEQMGSELKKRMDRYEKDHIRLQRLRKRLRSLPQVTSAQIEEQHDLEKRTQETLLWQPLLMGQLEKRADLVAKHFGVSSQALLRTALGAGETPKNAKKFDTKADRARRVAEIANYERIKAFRERAKASAAKLNQPPPKDPPPTSVVESGQRKRAEPASTNAARNTPEREPSAVSQRRELIRAKIYSHPEGATRTEEVAEYYDVTVRTIQRWVRKKRLRRGTKHGTIQNASIIELDKSGSRS